ncbi:MAG: hypothetical protein LUQ35_06490, partial [Methanoregula sp.]|nr:hypothetical protein [Methanoregula sp.]
GPGKISRVFPAIPAGFRGFLIVQVAAFSAGSDAGPAEFQQSSGRWGSTAGREYHGAGPATAPVAGDDFPYTFTRRNPRSLSPYGKRL